MTTLIIFNGYWADEMKVNSHLICNQEQEEMIKKIQGYGKETLENTEYLCVSLGSNEENEYENALELFNELEIKEISQEEANTIKKYFGTSNGAADIDGILCAILRSIPV